MTEIGFYHLTRSPLEQADRDPDAVLDADPGQLISVRLHDKRVADYLPG